MGIDLKNGMHFSNINTDLSFISFKILKEWSFL